MPHKNTIERFTYLTVNLCEMADIEICFPEEDPASKNADIFILEEPNHIVTDRLLSAKEPPIIVLPKEGVSQKNIRYFPNFTKQFPKLLKEIADRVPMLRLQQKNKSYFYNQKEILYLQKDESVTICFRYGNKIVSKQSFRKITKQLSEQLFFPVGETTFLNIEYISGFIENAVCLQNGEKFFFPPEQAEQVKNAFFKTKYLSHPSNL